MTSENHQQLAQFLKDVHLTLRKSSNLIGPEKAWRDHCQNKSVLKKYSHCMQQLATIHWAENCASANNEATSRIKWTAGLIFEYFINNAYESARQKEKNIASKINVKLDVEEKYCSPIKVIDVGSCYNPFSIYEYLDVTPIDLCPADSSVLECDFLNTPLGLELQTTTSEVKQLPCNYYQVVTFCFLLEYIPTSDLRIRACETAYRILRPEGLLIINTPDSKHVGANSKLMKCWQHTLAKIGFMRIKYEKLKHMHCMAFRKAICKEVAHRWAEIHDGPNMQYALHIPQDFNNDDRKGNLPNSYDLKSHSANIEHFTELPFYDNVNE